uniref:Reverse transcriptase domain-containing protein n=1 Tax=Tanacetum cinerariifolium TaxID=118510 RepID=A0A6L2M643_TANCI|nr:hypothetical protein [Tanacetum cinerariifolium]
MHDDFQNQMRNFMQNLHDGPSIRPLGVEKDPEATKDTELPSTEDIQPLSVTLEDKRECDVPISENSPVCDNHSDTFFDSKIDDDISVYDDYFEDIEYVEALLSDPEIVSVEEENVVHQAENDVYQEELDFIKGCVFRKKNHRIDEDCHQKEFLCMHDNVDDLIESALNTKLLSINSQRLDKKEQEVKNIVEQPAERGNRIESLQNFRVIRKSSISLNTSQISLIHAIAPILSTKEPEHLLIALSLSTKKPKNSLSMGYEHLSITPETESDEVTESNAKNLLPIPSECEVTLEDKMECDELIYENSSTIDVCDNHSEILFNSNNDDLSSDDESFKDIEYVDASVPNPAIVSIEEENVVQQEEEESDNSLLDNYSPEFETFCDHSKETRSGKTTHANYSLPEYDLFCFENEPDQERLINLVENDIPDNSLNDHLLEEVDLFLSDNSIPPGIENFADDPEGDIRFLEELLIDNSILSHESSDSNFEDNPLISRPPPEPPDDNFDLEPEVISAVMEDINEPDEHFNLGGEIFVSTNIEDLGSLGLGNMIWERDRAHGEVYGNDYV